MKKSWIVFLGLALGISACTLAEDVTPPPGYQATQAALPTNPAAQPISAVPASPPNPNSGQAIYTERCAPCHGDQGQGDGPQAAQLPNPPTSLGDPSVAREATPADWYTVVTQGRLDQMMPPFASLTDAQRWDVVAYALNLSISSSDLDQAQQAYQESCASCHGQDGGTPTGGVTLSDPEWMANQSQEAMVAAISQGSGQMPSFADKLSEDQLWAMSAYVRQLAYNITPATPAVASSTGTETPAPSVETASIVASVSLGSGASESSPPADLEVTLHGFDGQQEVVTQTGTLDADGSVNFPDLEVVSGRLFIVSAEYQGVRYVSDVSHLTGPGQTTKLPLTLYDTTTDTSAVRASRLHILLDFPSDGVMQVIELWVLSNTGDHTVVASDSGGLTFSLPAGANNISFQDDSVAQLATRTSDGFSLGMPLRPGQESAQLIFSFNLPYQGGADFHQPLAYPVDGVTVLLPDGGPAVAGGSVQDQGVQDLGGSSYHQYNLQSFDAGGAIDMQVAGGPSPLLSLAGNWQSIVLGAAALVLVLAAAIAWYRPSLLGFGPVEVDDEYEEDEEGNDDDDVEHLMAMIARLDDAHEAGEVDDDEYTRRRADLKKRALEAMRAEDD
jgi:mono/diheme cytochrome c family protein